MANNIICMKWGTKYGPEYVNRLHSMVSRHLTLPHRFVCFTEDGSGLNPGIDVLPLPEMDLPPGKERGWRKLSTFQNPLADLEGTALFLDLDVVIVDSIDPFFAQDGEFLIIHDWDRPWRITGNSSVYRFSVNRYPEIYAEFMADIDAVKAKHRNEQAYLSEWMHQRGLLQYWPKEWCVSFKRNCLPRWPVSLWKTPPLPEKARIVVFHGNPNPPDAIEGRIRGAFRHLRPTPWVADHWK